MPEIGDQHIQRYAEQFQPDKKRCEMITGHQHQPAQNGYGEENVVFARQHLLFPALPEVILREQRNHDTRRNQQARKEECEGVNNDQRSDLYRLGELDTPGRPSPAPGPPASGD